MGRNRTQDISPRDLLSALADSGAPHSKIPGRGRDTFPSRYTEPNEGTRRRSLREDPFHQFCILCKAHFTYFYRYTTNRLRQQPTRLWQSNIVSTRTPDYFYFYEPFRLLHNACAPFFLTAPTVIIIENLPRQVCFFCTGRFSGACWLNRQVF